MGDEDFALNVFSPAAWAAAGGTNCSLAASSAWSYAGGQSLLMTMTATGTAATPNGVRSTMAAGQQAGGSAWVMSPAGCSVTLNIDFYNSGGGHISGVASSIVTLPPLTPAFLTLSPVTAPAGTATAVVHPVITASSATASQVYADRVRMSPGGFQVSYADDIEITTDIQFLYNDIVVTRNYDQATFRAVDTTSRAKYFPRTFSRTVYADLSDVQAVVDVADWLVGDYSTKRQRVSRITVNAMDNADLWPFVLGTDIGDLVAFQRNPVGATGIAGTHMILSIEFEFSPDVATFTYVLAPVTTGSILTLDDPVYGLIGSTNGLAW
jgi:hypothetical protein